MEIRQKICKKCIEPINNNKFKKLVHRKICN